MDKSRPMHSKNKLDPHIIVRISSAMFLWKSFSSFGDETYRRIWPPYYVFI